MPGPPGPPAITGAGNTVNIIWTAPTTGGAPTGYTIVARAVAGGPVITTVPVGNALRTSVVAPDGSFHVTIRASNASGDGPESAGAAFNVPIRPAPPGPPTGLVVATSVNQATFTWTPPSTGGAATGYLLLAALSSGGPPVASLPLGLLAPPQVTVSNISAGTYFVRLAATNAGGSSAFSNEVVVSVVPPGPPALTPATVAGGRVTLSWSAPTTGSRPDSYLVVASLATGGPPMATLPVPGTSVTVPAPAGSYTVRVYGVNAVGTGAASNPITVIVP
jgi:hypothetical protein